MVSEAAREAFEANDVELTVPAGAPRPVLIIVMVRSHWLGGLVYPQNPGADVDRDPLHGESLITVLVLSPCEVGRGRDVGWIVRDVRIIRSPIIPARPDSTFPTACGGRLSPAGLC